MVNWFKNEADLNGLTRCSLHAFFLCNRPPSFLPPEKGHFTFSNVHTNYALNLFDFSCSFFSSLSHKSPFVFFLLFIFGCSSLSSWLSSSASYCQLSHTIHSIHDFGCIKYLICNCIGHCAAHRTTFYTVTSLLCVQIVKQACLFRCRIQTINSFQELDYNNITYWLCHTIILSISCRFSMLVGSYLFACVLLLFFKLVMITASIVVAFSSFIYPNAKML